MQQKKCNVCGETKPISEFYNLVSGKYGVMGKCKQCYLAILRTKRIKKNNQYIVCSQCGMIKPSYEFYRRKEKYKTICKSCAKGSWKVPGHIKRIAEKYNFPSTLLMGWTRSAIECLELGCNCRKCPIRNEKCQMKKAVLLLTMIHGKPVGYNEPTII